ncbi:putative sulfoacetate transporter SauU [Sporomusa acidovorans DSM 3132]|uniref:Sulfoacetate transporter SauU n=2 Tax=Sporomusa TaxID=2375 RepID=A0ABZ3J5K3_SPOA4|nr:putative sulfoacetate transporter SauU [Sporomusa acidovorans DSM 3132]SDF02842.1 Sugar phosphate permease [Sporomusa acidovorans]
MNMANPKSGTQLKPTNQRWLVAAILFLAVFFSYLDRVNVSVLVVDPAFLTAMGISGAVAKGMLMTSFLIAYGVGNVILSPLGDIFGPRKAMAACIGIWIISMVIGGLAPTYAIITISRVLLGLGEAMHFPMQSKFVKQWFPPQERGKANAVWQTGMAVAPAIAMPFFTWIIHFSGWRMSFFVLAALSLIPLMMVWWYTADYPRQSKRANQLEKDYIEAGQAREADAAEKNTGEEKQGIVAAFKSFADNRNFWLLTFFYMMHVSIYFGTLTWLPSYLKEARGFSWAAMGILSSLPFVLAVGTKILSGYLADKLPRRSLILIFEMVGVGVGVFFAAYVADNNIAAAFMVLGVGAVGLGGPAAWTVMQSVVPSKGVASAAGLMNGLSNGVSALAPVAIGGLIAFTGTYAGGLSYIIGCSVVGCIMAIILYLKKI